MSVQQLVRTTEQVNATTVLQPQVAADLQKKYGSALAVRYFMTQEELNYLSDHTSAELVYKGTHSSNDHVVFHQADLWARDHAVEYMYETINVRTVDPVTKAAVFGTRYRARDGRRVLVIGATIKDYTQLNADPDTEFYCAFKDAKDMVRSVTWFFKRKSRTMHSVHKLRKMDPRIHGELPRRTQGGQRFTTLFLPQSGYNISPDDLARICDHTGAKEVVYTMFLPPELVIEDMMPNPYYRVAPAPAPRIPDSTPSAELYRQAINDMDYLRAQDQYIEVQWVHGPDGDARLVVNSVPGLSSADAAYANSMMLDYWVKANRITEAVNIKTTTQLMEVIKLGLLSGRPRWVSLLWKNNRGVTSHGYVHNHAIWAHWFRPAWFAGGRNWVNESMFCSAHMRFGVAVSGQVGGRVVATYMLHEAEQFVRVMSIKTMLKTWSNSPGKVHYESVPKVLFFEFVHYVTTLMPETVLGNAIVPALATWLRKRIVNVRYAAGLECRTDVKLLMRLDDLAVTVALSARQELIKNDQALKADAKGLSRMFGSFFTSLIEDTVLDSFLTWLTKSRYHNRLVLEPPQHIDWDVDMKPIADWTPFKGKFTQPPSQPPRRVQPTGNSWSYDSDSDSDVVSGEDSDEETSAGDSVSELEGSDAVALDECDEYDPDHCLFCDVLRLTGTPKYAFTCHHADAKLTLRLSAKEISETIIHMMQCEEDRDTPEALRKVIAAARQTMSQLPDGFEIDMQVWHVRGMPGTGKSYFLRALGEVLVREGKTSQIAVALPFAKLLDDYVADAPSSISPGKKIGAIFSAKTQHRAVRDFLGYKYIFVDELGALSYDKLAAISFMNPDSVLVLVGDVNQTQVLEDKSEGLNFFKACERNGVDLSKLNTHTLLLNRRNPKNLVEIGNRFLPADCQMVAHRTDEVPIRIVKAGSGPMPEGTLVTFSTRSWDHYTAGLEPVGTSVKSVSVRKCQGSTIKHMVLAVHSEYDDYPFTVDALNLVAFTRPTTSFTIVVNDYTPTIMAWMQRAGLPLIEQTGTAFAPEIGRVVTDEVEEGDDEEEIKLVRKAKIVEPAHAELTVLKSPVYAVTGPEPRIELAKATPAASEYGDFSRSPDNQPLTAANKPVVGTTGGYRLTDNLDAVMQHKSTAAAIKTAMERQHKNVGPSNPLGPGDVAMWRQVIKNYFQDAKTPGYRFDAADALQIIKEFLEDAQERNYFLRFFSEKTESADRDMLGEWEVALKQVTYIKDTYDKQRLTLKPQLKVTNATKDKSDHLTAAAKAGQAIASMPVWIILKYAIMIRLLTAMDKASNLKEVKSDRWATLFKTRVSDEDFCNWFNRLAKEMPATVKLVFADGEKTDSGATRALAHVVALYSEELIHYVGADVELMQMLFGPGYMGLVDVTTNMPIEVEYLKFRSKDKTPSGAPHTFYQTTTACKLGLYVQINTEGPVLHLTGGDDNAVIANVITENLAGKALFERTCNIKLNIMKREEPESVIEFCGHFITATDGDLYMTGQLLRRFERFLGESYRNEQHLAESKVALNDWLKRFSTAKAEVRLLRAATIQLVSDGLPLAQAQAEASAKLTALRNIARMSASDLMGHAKYVEYERDGRLRYRPNSGDYVSM